jgi:predicted DNA-binding protein with PD1-like motif
MRRLVQPGPVAAARSESFAAVGRVLDYDLAPGANLIEALTGPLLAAGFRSASITFAGAALHPFRYVLPGPPRDGTHVAWFSDPHLPAGDPARATRVETANATFGWRDGTPFVHCHGVWTEPDGTRRGGHMLPEETFLAAPAPARAWGLAVAAIRVDPDPETNFPLFHPVAAEEPVGVAIAGRPARLVVARVRPNEEIGAALVALCRRHGLHGAAVRGSLGSLIGAAFADGRTVADPATEVLVREGRIAPGPGGALAAELDLVVVDGAGHPHAGRLAPRENAVCITFEVMLEAEPAAG